MHTVSYTIHSAASAADPTIDHSRSITHGHSSCESLSFALPCAVTHSTSREF